MTPLNHLNVKTANSAPRYTTSLEELYIDCQRSFDTSFFRRVIAGLFDWL
jgi:hypothetical protein